MGGGKEGCVKSFSWGLILPISTAITVGLVPANEWLRWIAWLVFMVWCAWVTEGTGPKEKP